MNQDLTNHSFSEFTESIIKMSIYDIVTFNNFCNPKSIESFISTSKKSPSCVMSPVERWHPSNIKYAYEFLFQNYKIKRNGREGEVEYSLQSFLDSFGKSINKKTFYSMLTAMIIEKIGYFPIPIFSISFYLDSPNGAIDMEKLSKDIISKLISLTYQESITWNKINIEDIENLTNSEDMKAVKAYRSYLRENKHSKLILTLSSYEKNVINTKAYREYIIKIERQSGRKITETVIFKSMGKLWRVVDSRDTNGALAAKTIADYLKLF